MPPEAVAALAARGVTDPWLHQVAAMEAAHAGRHVILTTGTASGKSLGYLLPVICATRDGARHPASALARVGSPASPSGTRPLTAAELHHQLAAHRTGDSRAGSAIYLAPTKALAHDQLRACTALGLDDWRVTTLDGDSDEAERRWARDHAGYVLTNPDMLHHAVLPDHARWARLLGSLRYVVLDECHRYRGVFGAQVSAVVRRLRRLAAMYGARPTVIAASATVADGPEVLGRLAGVDPAEVVGVSEDSSPHGSVDLVLWQPDAHHDTEAADLLADCVLEGRRTVAFIASRAMAEKVAVRAQEVIGPAGRVDAYRAGYLASDRRRLEADLQSGALDGVAATNALELGVDIAGLDAVVISGFPGTRAALWQQAGRAGRRGAEALVVLVARQNPLDAYFLAHPDELVHAGPERTILDPANPYVLGPHLAAAAQEAPLTPADTEWFGPEMPRIADRLARQGVLRRRRTGWYWTHPTRAAALVDLRGTGARPIDIVDRDTGRVIGVADAETADRTVHPEAVYLHQGDTWMVDSLDTEACEALVHREAPGWTTQPIGTTDIRILGTDASRPFGAGLVSTGTVELTGQVTAYLRRDAITGEVWDQTPMPMPEHRLRTRAVWLTVPDEVVAATGLSAPRLAGAVHAAEHTAIGLLPLFATCDRWDIGGVSTIMHPDTGHATIFVHDGQAGGSGYASRGFEVAGPWWRATLERLVTCPCDGGCPSCIQSPKCGNANQVLDKAAATILLTELMPAG